VEKEVIAAAQEREAEHMPLDNIESLYDFSYSTPDGKMRYSEEVAQKYRAAKAEKVEYLGEKVAFTGAITDSDEIEKATEGKVPVVITGASEGSWKKIAKEDQENIRVVMQVLANTLNSQTSYIVTGGTNHGVERVMHEVVNARNNEAEEPLVVLGTLTLEATNDATNQLDKDTITHATILELHDRLASNWQELPDTQLEYARQRGGSVIAVGGGDVVNNMIQRAHNIGVDLHLMDGPNGASTKKSRSLAGNGYSFKTAEELITRLYLRNPHMFHENLSLENIVEYVGLQRREFELRVLEAEERNISETERLVKVVARDREQKGQTIGE